MHKHGRKAKYKTDHDYVYQIHEYNVDIEMNQIYLMGEEIYMSGTGNEDPTEPGVEFMMANRFIRNINLCMRKNPDVPILIHMKTCGGFWEEGMAIHNAIKACPNPVTILNYTHARSMSSLILQAANKRVMMPDSCFMFHEGTYGFEGTVKQAKTEHEQLIITGDRMLDIYVESMQREGIYMDKDEKWIKKHLIGFMEKKEEVYFTPQKTIEYGLADEIFGGEPKGYDWDKLMDYTKEQLAR